MNLAEDIADENEPRSAEEVLLATIDATADDKLTRFAIPALLSLDSSGGVKTASASVRKSSSPSRGMPIVGEGVRVKVDDGA